MEIRKDLHSSEYEAGRAAAEAEIKPDLAKLHAYAQAKLALAGQLRVVRQALKSLGRETAERQCDELVVKLAEDRFTLAVLGQFKRGKSSLMNAIVGRELLPTGVLPLTSAVTVLRYGPVERLAVEREGWALPEELPLSALAEYVTEQGNPSNVKKVKTAGVELPAPFLRRGVEFVDTPGVGSAITANTATTYGFLPECDAVLFVTSVDTPLTNTELAFLKDIEGYVDKIFFVVNKTDLIADEERSEVVRFVAETIKVQTGRGAVKVFPVSARQGLAAKTSGDETLYERSGLKALEEALASFLAEEKAATFLAAVARKALRIAADDHAEKEPATKPLREARSAVDAVAKARAKIAAIYRRIVEGRVAEAAEPSPGVPAEAAPAVEASPHSPAETDIAADLRTRGCPVCRHLAKQSWDFLTHWQYRLGTDEQAQAEFAAMHGFCPLHAWQLLAVSSPHGASVGYAPLAEQLACRLRELAAAPSGTEVLRLARSSHNCHVCELLRKAEEDYIAQLAGLLGGSAGRSQYRNSQGACLRHLGMLLTASPTAESRQFLLFHAAQRFNEDAEDMRSFAMKHEALRRGLQNGNEADAYRRALVRTVGDRRVCVPWEDGVI